MAPACGAANEHTTGADVGITSRPNGHGPRANNARRTPGTGTRPRPHTRAARAAGDNHSQRTNPSTANTQAKTYDASQPVHTPKAIAAPANATAMATCHVRAPVSARVAVSHPGSGSMIRRTRARARGASAAVTITVANRGVAAFNE